MKTYSKKSYKIFTAVIIIAWIAGLYFFAWDLYENRDSDACGAMVCAVSVSCIWISLLSKNFSFIKRVIMGIGIANIITLAYLIIDDGFSYEGKNILIVGIVITLIYSGFYVWAVKQEKKVAAKKK